MLSEFLGKITGILKIVVGATTSIFNVVVVVILSPPSLFMIACGIIGGFWNGTYLIS